jgi:hypothetical protein
MMSDKPDKQSQVQQNELSHLAEEIIANIGVGFYIVQNGHFVYVSPLFLELSRHIFKYTNVILLVNYFNLWHGD